MERLKEIAGNLQAVIYTIRDLDIKATPENASHLMGIYGILTGARDELRQMAEEEKDGQTDAE